MKKRKIQWRRGTAFLLGLLMMISSLFCGMDMRTVQAADKMSIYLTVGRNVGYNNHFTHEFTLQDGTQAYCLQPSSRYPASGTYTAEKVNNRLLTAVMYYGYGGPGWDTELGLRNNTPASARDDIDMHMYWTHVLAAYAYGSSDAFKGVDQGTVEGLVAIANFWAQNANVPSGYSAYIFNPDQTTQTMGFGYYEPAGKVEIQKSSANPSITDGNACYSLEGAVYQLLDKNLSVATTLTTDANGYACAEGIAPGSYTLKEITAPKGYALPTESQNNHNVIVQSSQTTVVKVTDNPQNDPVSILLEKVDSSSNTNEPQGNASLAGAEFTVKYYAGMYDSDPAKLGETAVRTWVFKTDEDGFVYYSEEWKVSGDELYYMTNGEATIPLGTITIQETKAPENYLINSQVFIRQINSDGYDEWVNTYNQPTISEQVIRGGVKIRKFDSDTGTAISQGDATLAGARFDIINLNDGPVFVDGKTCSSGQTVLTLTTNEAGLAQTAADALPAGHYKIIENIPPNGYLQEGILEREFDITRNGVVVDLTAFANGIQNEVIKGSILIVKHTDNGETGIETPEAGAEFQVYLKSAGSYEAAKETERDTITCDEDGFAQTKDLPYGTYIVHQTKSWDGRDLLEDFQVYINSDGQVYRYIINNQNFESYLKVVKTDAETGQNIAYAGAGFRIYDPDGNLVTMEYTYPTVTEVDTFYTAEDGSLMTPERLPYGRGYTLVEVQAPYGYVLDSTPVKFDIAPESAGKEDGYTVIRLTKSDQPQKGTITVTKTGEVLASVAAGEENGEMIYQPVWEKENLPGAVFEIRAAEDIKTLDGTLRYAKGELVDTITTGADGTAISKALYLGKYTAQEVKAPDGMVQNKEPREVELTYAGQNVSLTEASAAFENERQKVEVTLTKRMEDDEQFGFDGLEERKDVLFGLYATEEIAAADGTVIPADGLLEILAPGEDGIAKALTDLPLGSFYLQEIATNEAYILGDNKYPIDFDYAGQDTVLVKIAANDGEPIENELIRGTIVGSKRDYDNLGVPGALIGLFAPDTGYFTEEAALTTTVSGKDGIFRFDEVPYGTYLIRELEAPEGYLLNENVYEVTVTEDGAEVPVVIVDWEIPSISTTLIDAKTGTQNVLAETDMELIDEVHYENLIPGQTYLIKGILMDRADETGNTPILINGEDTISNLPFAHEVTQSTEKKNAEKVVSSLIFTPEEREGTIAVTFQLDGSGLAGKTIVAYEQLYLPRYGVENPNAKTLNTENPDRENLEDWIAVTAHEDIENGAQTVYVPELGTTLTDTATGEKVVEAGERIALSDRVHYKNLIPGQSYLMKGILMDKETGKPLTIDGNPVERSLSFEPAEPEGYLDMSFVFDGSRIGGKYLVAFEKLYISITENPNPEEPEDWKETANHENMEDEGQTVYVKKPIEPAKTGDDRKPAVLTGGCLVGAGGALYLFSSSLDKRRNRKKIY